MLIQTKKHFLQFGKRKDVAPEQLQTKSAATQLVRNESGRVVGTTKTYAIKDFDNYVNLLFRENQRLQNFVYMYENIPEIQFPINYIVSRILNGNFTVKRWDDDTVVWSETATSPKDKIVGERMKKFLTNPNPMQTFKEFVKQFFIYKLLIGDSFIYGAGLPISKNIFETCDNYWILPAHNIEVKHPRKTQLFWADPNYNVVESYNLRSPYGNATFDPRMVMHVKDFNSLDIGDQYFYGKSRLIAHKYPVANLVAVYEARNVIYTKRGAIGAVVNKKEDADGFIPMTEIEKKDIRNEFHKNYGLESGKDPMAIVDVPVEFVKFGMTIQELQPFEETLASASVIAGAYNIDSVLIPRKDHSTFSNLREAEGKVYTSTVIPEAIDFCENISNFLGLNDYGYYLDVNFDHVEVLAEARNKKEIAKRSITERCRIEFNNGIITLNDWRAALGKESIDNSLFDKTIFEMTDQEIEQIRNKRIGS